MRRWLEQHLLWLWYQQPRGGYRVIYYLLKPLSWVFGIFCHLRQRLYRCGVLRCTRLPVPVIVVGNLTVGGTGKTPAVMAIAAYLREQGYQPGIVMRGYQRRDGRNDTVIVTPNCKNWVSDEASLIARKSQCMVAIGRNRVAACRALLAQHNINIIISDDGLQHYALERDIEIVLVDGQRRWGNGALLPAGPLRESLARLRTVSFIIAKQLAAEGEHQLDYQQTALYQVANPHITYPLTTSKQQLKLPAHAVTAIGNAQQFFQNLTEAGIDFIAHAFPDHHPFTAQDIDFASGSVIMTEKDAIKIKDFADERHWAVMMHATLPQRFWEQLQYQLQTILSHANANE